MGLLLALQPVLMKKSLLETLPKRPQLKRPQPILLLTTVPLMKMLQRKPAAEILATCQTSPIPLLPMKRVGLLLRQLSTKAQVLRPNATTSFRPKLTLPTRSRMEMKRWVRALSSLLPALLLACCLSVPSSLWLDRARIVSTCWAS